MRGPNKQPLSIVSVSVSFNGVIRRVECYQHSYLVLIRLSNYFSRGENKSATFHRSTNAPSQLQIPGETNLQWTRFSHREHFVHANLV